MLVLLTGTGEDDHVLEECEHHGDPRVVVVEDGERPQLGGNTVRPSDGRVAQLPQYPQYPGVVGSLTGITRGRNVVKNPPPKEKRCHWYLAGDWQSPEH